MRCSESEALRTWLERIERMHPQEIDLGLDRIRQVARQLGIVRVASHQIVVAGTNGKGSTLGLIEAASCANDWRVGTYTSPHLHTYNERIRIGGQPVDDETLIAAFESIEQARGVIPLTYFEFGTLAALLIFSRLSLDVCVLEVGLGGRLDAVNLVDADLALITSIGLDHMDWLGDNPDAIGKEKAGIMRAGVPVLLGETCPASVLEEAHRIGADPWRIGREFGFEGDWFYSRPLACRGESPSFSNLRLPLNNIALAAQASLWLCERMGSDKTNLLGHLWQAFGALNVPGRMQRMDVGGVPVYLDVGHNPQAADFLSRCLAKEAKAGQPVYVVYSCLKDKDAKSVVSVLTSRVDKWFAAPLDAPRAMAGKQLEEALGSVSESVVMYAQFEQALKDGLQQAGRDQAVLLVFGSFAVVEAAYSLLGAL